jgi:uncharacterized protein (PEP-CTERM system associated)
MRKGPSRTGSAGGCRRRVRLGRPAAIACVAAALQSAGPAAVAETWHFVPSIGLDETLTNNVNLSASDLARGDLVSVITPRLQIDEESPRTSLHGFVAAPTSLYAKTGAENNQVYPSANLLGNAELYEKFFQVEAAVNASQQFFNPFGPQPASIANATNNRYTSSLYRVSPFVQGTAPGEVKYRLRNDNTWVTLSGAPISTRNAFYDVWNGSVEGPVRSFGWAVEGNWNEVKFTEQQPQISELARARLIWQPEPQLRFDIDGGYENNRFPFVTYTGPIYGGGLQWTPTDRMKVVGNYEHRYFGSSYLFSFDNRTPLSAASISVSRNVTSYPQQLFTLPPTGNVAALLFFMFASRVPDPAARLALVQQFISASGLPESLSSAVPIYTQQITLQEHATGTFGLLGARNSVFLNLFWLRQVPITGSGNPLPPVLFAYNNNTQSGGALTWSHKLTPLVSLEASLTLSRTIANQPTPDLALSAKPKTDQGTARLTVSAPLSPRTTVYAGARYQKSRGYQGSTTDYEEVAGIAGINYTFK